MAYNITSKSKKELNLLATKGSFLKRCILLQNCSMLSGPVYAILSKSLRKTMPDVFGSLLKEERYKHLIKIFKITLKNGRNCWMFPQD